MAFTRNRGDTSASPSTNQIMNSINDAWYYGFDGATVFIIATDEQKGLSVKTPDESLELSGIDNINFAMNVHVSKLVESNQMILNSARWIPGHADIRSDYSLTKGWVEFKI